MLDLCEMPKLINTCSFKFVPLTAWPQMALAEWYTFGNSWVGISRINCLWLYGALGWGGMLGACWAKLQQVVEQGGVGEAGSNKVTGELGTDT